jgi:DMSO/TMAO reductase YedYZ molybdopterin-dependent catalytic subunit
MTLSASASSVPGQPPAAEPQNISSAAPDYAALQEGDFADYRLRVNGLVDNPVELGLTQLRALPSTQITQHFCIQGWSGVAKCRRGRRRAAGTTAAAPPRAPTA